MLSGVSTQAGFVLATRFSKLNARDRGRIRCMNLNLCVPDVIIAKPQFWHLQFQAYEMDLVGFIFRSSFCPSRRARSRIYPDLQRHPASGYIEKKWKHRGRD